MTKLTKLEAGKTYRLIDKEGYFHNHKINEDFYKRYFKDNCVTLSRVFYMGDGLIERNVVISLNEFIYFEEVIENETASTYSGNIETTCIASYLTYNNGNNCNIEQFTD